MVDKANLDDRDLFLFNASVIAGALIFLTISAFVTNPHEQLYRVMSQLYGLLLIVIFTLSSWFLLKGIRKWATIIMFYGFGWLVAFAGLLVVLTIFYAEDLLK